MYSVIGILIVLAILFIFSIRIGVEVVGLAVVTLLLWHGIWRLIDHIEEVMGADEKPLHSALVSISLATVLAFAFHRFQHDAAIEYIQQRF